MGRRGGGDCGCGGPKQQKQNRQIVLLVIDFSLSDIKEPIIQTYVESAFY